MAAFEPNRRYGEGDPARRERKPERSIVEALFWIDPRLDDAAWQTASPPQKIATLYDSVRANLAMREDHGQVLLLLASQMQDCPLFSSAGIVLPAYDAASTGGILGSRTVSVAELLFATTVLSLEKHFGLGLNEEAFDEDVFDLRLESAALFSAAENLDLYDESIPGSQMLNAVHDEISSLLYAMDADRFVNVSEPLNPTIYCAVQSAALIYLFSHGCADSHGNVDRLNGNLYMPYLARSAQHPSTHCDYTYN